MKTLVVFLLFLSFNSYAIWAPDSVTAVIPVTVNADYVDTAMANYTYQYTLDLSSEAQFKALIDSSQNVIVFDTTDSSVCNSMITYTDLNTVYLYWDGLTDASADKVFFVGAGSGINNRNTTAAFDGVGYTNFLGIDEYSDGATTNDYVASSTNIRISPATIGNQAKFGRGATLTGSAAANVDMISTNISGNTIKFTIEALVNVASAGPSGNGRIFSSMDGSLNGWMLHTTSAGYIRWFSSNTAAISAINVLTFGNWHHITVTCDANTKINIYCDGVLTGAANQGVTRANSALGIGIGNSTISDRSLPGIIDNVGIADNVFTAKHVLTRARMLMTPGSFYTQGTSIFLDGISISNVIRSMLNTGIGIGF